MPDSPDPMLTALIQMLERCGHPREEAEVMAATALERQAAIEPGCRWGHIHPEQIATLWQQAAKHGKRKLVLEITADAPDYQEWTHGRVRVEVKDAQTWTAYEQQRADARARKVN